VSIRAREHAEAFLKRMELAGVKWDHAGELARLTTDERDNVAIVLAERGARKASWRPASH